MNTLKWQPRILKPTAAAPKLPPSLQHNTTNRTPCATLKSSRGSRANCQTRTLANDAKCSRQKSRASESPESPARQPYRTPNESDQSWGSRCCFHGDWMHHGSSSQDPPGSSGLAALMDDSSGMRESWSSPCLSLSAGEK